MTRVQTTIRAVSYTHRDVYKRQLPALAMKFLGIQQAFAYFYGGTSLLIMVGVVLDTLKQIESYLLMRH